MSGKVEVSNSINLKASSIIPWVWNKSRLIDCMRFIGTSKTPWKVDPCNHNVRFLFPMCYTIVYGGNHSLTTGILKQSDAEFETDYYYDLSELYKTIRYEGKYFYSQQGKFKLKPNEKIKEFNYQLSVPKNFSEPLCFGVNFLYHLDFVFRQLLLFRTPCFR